MNVFNKKYSKSQKVTPAYVLNFSRSVSIGTIVRKEEKKAILLSLNLICKNESTNLRFLKRRRKEKK